MRNLLISLEGNIGSGKSTLLARIKDMLHDQEVAVLPEPVELWAAPMQVLGHKSMLQSYYEDGRANSFAFQMFVLKTRLDQVMAVASGRTILSERCMSSHDAIFATAARLRGDMTDVEWITYRGWTESVTCMSGEDSPNGVVYLRTLPAVCAQRRRQRNRGAEAELPDSLLKGLHDDHEAYIDSLTEKGIPVLVVDGDIEQSEPAHCDVVRVIVRFVQGLQAEKADMLYRTAA